MKGQKVVVYFYPKDDTPGCTKEAQGFRDNYAKYEGKDMVVLGVSMDDEASHKAFKEKYGDLILALEKYKPEETVMITVLRDKKEVKLELVLDGVD